MVTQRQKTEMRDYLVDKLRESHGVVEPRTKEILQGSGDTDYLLLGKEKDGIILLVNRIYTKDSFNKIYNGVRNQIPNIGVVLYKDGKTFFRSAMAGEEDTGIKRKRRKMSLSHYTNEQKNRMISLRHEEKFLRERGRQVQYYQPESAELEQGIVTYSFQPVEFRYDGPTLSGWNPEDKHSERLFMWANRTFADGDLVLENGYLKPRPSK